MNNASDKTFAIHLNDKCTLQDVKALNYFLNRAIKMLSFFVQVCVMCNKPFRKYGIYVGSTMIYDAVDRVFP
jgi:hypothetical protein